MSEKSNRALVPFTNEHFAVYCLKMVGQPYWFGCCGYKATNSLLNRKTAQYPDHYGASRTARYKQDIKNGTVVCDCIGGAKGYAWSGGGQVMLDAIGNDQAVTNKYGSNNCPDKGANSMFSYAKTKGMAWGAIGTLPEVIGLALHKDGHVGYTVGDGYAVEWRGFADGCVRTMIKDRGWQSWYQLPFIDYGSDAGAVPADTNVPLGSRLLAKGMEGNDVRMLQELLLELGYALPKYGADGQFGAETEAALKAFQRAEKLEVDGKYGDKAHAALMDAMADKPKDSAEPAQSEQPVEMKPTGITVAIVSDNGCRVNIRTGNGTAFGRISQVDAGTSFPYVATAVNGWNAVVVNGQVGWVSGQYSRVL